MHLNHFHKCLIWLHLYNLYKWQDLYSIFPFLYMNDRGRLKRKQKKIPRRPPSEPYALVHNSKLSYFLVYMHTCIMSLCISTYIYIYIYIYIYYELRLYISAYDSDGGLRECFSGFIFLRFFWTYCLSLSLFWTFAIK